MTSSLEDLTDYYRQTGLFKALNSEFESKVAGLPKDKHDVPLAGTFPKRKTRRPSIFEEYLGKSPERLITKSTIPVAEKFPNDSSSYKLALEQKKAGKTIYQMEKEKGYNNPEMLRFLYGFTPSTREPEETCVNLLEIGSNGQRMMRNVQTEELISFYENNDGVQDYNRNVVEYPPLVEEMPERRASESPSTVLRIFVTPDSKEEILTVISPVPGDDFTDSGIENNGNFQSPTTSVDYSPRSEF
ncbi:hypothetical protein QR680_015051 [Steinernema hermaphroditum]|uniref:Uncharacterized protein n=1 Tax=Steinernema hermaphroditum TaxID=289476 RepID=A0AA39M490_9BILA|nr:hypothetical protein QR680_015051 [Steinernema hermaphroditum]